MKNLSEIQNKINNIKAENQKTLNELKEKAQSVFAKKMNSPKNQKIIKDMVSRVENSKELTNVPNDQWLYLWSREDFSKLANDDFQKDLLQEYMRENFCVEIDFKNDVLMSCIGPCIIINDDGDILDEEANKWIIKKSDYRNEENELDIKLRNELIEKYMEKSGYFPSVVSVDRHGNAFFVNTKEN
jgi:hypothetical protein